MHEAEQTFNRVFAEIESLEAALRQAYGRARELDDAVATSTLDDVEARLPADLSFAEIRRRLSFEEQRVLGCYLECSNDKEVARRTGKKLQTVRNQMASIERKLAARGRGAMIVKVLVAYFQEKRIRS
jgi:DNA-binding NarL/FixJ family response regulator